MSRKLLFGYGSLIDPLSLRATAPGASDIRPSYIKGFVRDFNVWDGVGYTETHPELAGIPYCALNVYRCTDEESKVNGVTFTVDEADYQKLLIREYEYGVVETLAYDYITNEVIDSCLVFSASQGTGSFAFDCAPQMKYLSDILEAAAHHGEAYLQDFLNSTKVDGRPLRNFPELLTVSADNN